MPSLFESAFTHAAIGMALVAPEGRFLRVNASLCRLVGYSEAELLALTFQDITHPDDLDTDLDYVGQLLRGERETYQMEKRYLRQDGRVIWVHLSVSLMREDDGRPRYFIAQIEDITARKDAEQDLAIFFDLPLVFRAVLGPNAAFQRLSPQWVTALGYTREEFLALRLTDLVHPDDLEPTLAGLAGLFQGQPLEFFQNRNRRADGTYLWLMSCAMSIPERQCAFVVATDITPLKEAEARALAEARENQRLYVELQKATAEIRSLQEGLVTVCAWTKQVRDGETWEAFETFLSRRLRLKISHGMSDEVAGRMLDELHLPGSP